MPTRDQVLRILAIARAHSSTRGACRGLSLRDLTAEAEYRALRPEIAPAQVADVLRSVPVLVDDWLAYSEDKRTHLGYGFGPSPVGDWLVDGPVGHRERFASRCDACSDFVLRELDFWVAIADAARTDA